MAYPDLLLQAFLPLLPFTRRFWDLLQAFLLLLRGPIPSQAPDRRFRSSSIFVRELLCSRVLRRRLVQMVRSFPGSLQPLQEAGTGG